MKKKIIAAGAASLAVAAMPVVGVFAANVDYASVTDKIKLNVTKTCKMQADENLEATVAEPAAKGTVVDLNSAVAGSAYAEAPGTVMYITCNSAAGWTLSADATALTASGTNQTIPFGAYNATDSMWSARIQLGGDSAASTNVAVTNGWEDNTATSAANVVIAQAAGNAGEKLAVNGLTVSTYYKAHTSSNQAAGSYAGTIKYTFADLGAN